MVKVVKILNNSFVFSEDENQQEIIVMGKGIGFNNKVGETIDPSTIERIFSPNDNLDTKEYARVLESMPKEYLDAIDKSLLDLDEEYLDDRVFIMLLDHISFAIERFQKGIRLQNKLLWETRKFYPDEFKKGLAIVQKLNQLLDINLPEEEAGNIAFHLINAQTEKKDMENVVLSMKMLKDILNLIQYQLRIEFDPYSLRYSRLVVHLQYFILRVLENEQNHQNNDNLYDNFKEKYPIEHKCAQLIRSYVSNVSMITINDEEVFYLMIHLIRLNSFER